MIHKFKFYYKYLLQFFLTIVGIGVITASTYTMFLPRGERLSEFWNQLQIFFWSFFFFKNLEVNLKDVIYLPFYSTFAEPYFYSLSILFCAFILSIIAALALAYATFMSPNIIKKMIHAIVVFLQSIPDVVVLLSLQLFFFWFYHKTNIKLIDPVSGFESKAYLLPIIVLSIVPTIQLFQMIYLSIEEEKIKDYVEYARAKGLSNSWILLRHIVRNVSITLLSNSQLIFWLMISNLLIIEYLFNMNGYFSFLYKNIHAPEIFFMSLVLLFIPFFVIDLVLKTVLNRLKGENDLV